MESGGDASQTGGGGGHKEIYTYEAPWTTYTMAWSHRDTTGSGPFRIALGSYKEQYSNQIHIIELTRNDTEGHTTARGSGSHTSTTGSAASAGGVASGSGFRKLCEVDHPYPATRVAWCPAVATAGSLGGVGADGADLLVTAGDYLRLWRVDGSGQAKMRHLLNNSRDTEYCAPITSFAWSDVNAATLCACSVDTTCTVWDVNKMAPRTQLIAHDKEVFDVSFLRGSADVFGTVGADGSLRVFDLRSLEHSTILYESDELAPLLRLSCNQQDPNYIAVIQTSSPKATIIDIRLPSIPVTELCGHQASINAIAWAPQSPNHIATCADDRQTYIWDITFSSGSSSATPISSIGGGAGSGGGSKGRVIEEPILAYAAEGEVNSLVWDGCFEHWMSICFGNKFQVLKI